jgi:aspartate/methionine/tyrosine aminotransferase
VNSDNAAGGWGGRFPKNDIISLLDVNRPLNLAESTAQDLTLGELLRLVALGEISSLRIGYGSSAGSEPLRTLVGESCGVGADCVVTTQGTALGLFLLAFELCRPGDEVVLLRPSFPPSRDALVGCGVTVREVICTFDEGYRTDVAKIAAHLSEKTRLVSLATPQNPSGVGTSNDTLRELLSLMRTRSPDAYLFVDETYREAVYGSNPVPPSAAGLDPRVICGASVSKAHGAPGLRVGWLTVVDAALRERLIVAKMNIVISGSVLDEAIAAALLARREQVLKPRRILLAQGLEVLATWQAQERTRIDWVRPDGGALCCLRLRASVFDTAAVHRFWTRLSDLDLQLAAGSWFGEDNRVFRLGFGYLPLERLPSALAALSRAMDQVAR